jgi:hypothetical protein
MPYAKIVMDSGTEFLYELDGPIVGRVSDEGVIQGLQETFGRIMGLVKETAQSAWNGLQNIQESSRPNELGVSFGVKVTAQAGVVFASAGTEGAFTVTMKWEKK